MKKLRDRIQDVRNDLANADDLTDVKVVLGEILDLFEDHQHTIQPDRHDVISVGIADKRTETPS